MRRRIQWGSQNKGHGKGNGHDNQPFTADPAVCRTDGADNQAELTVVGKTERGEYRGTGPQFETGEEEKEKRHLERHNNCQESCNTKSFESWSA